MSNTLLPCDYHVPCPFRKCPDPAFKCHPFPNLGLIMYGWSEDCMIT